MMAKADTNDDDDFVSLAEFATLNATMVGETAIGPPTRTSGCQAVRVFNANNGTISAAELVRVLCSLGKSTFVVHCCRMIEGVDQNVGSFIFFKEFKIMMAGAIISHPKTTYAEFVATAGRKTRAYLDSTLVPRSDSPVHCRVGPRCQPGSAQGHQQPPNGAARGGHAELRGSAADRIRLEYIARRCLVSQSTSSAPPSHSPSIDKGVAQRVGEVCCRGEPIGFRRRTGIASLAQLSSRQVSSGVRLDLG
uniref:Uncharacterized protein n=1 Tax=Zea mays TaxID=4577 RepID=A0A804LGW2_MAIZE